ncbi:hypothetical protein ACWYXJ_23045 [Janthinobacterium lividum]|uniref:hypothetical protein n=1 Tax=Janthinobacterium sp. FT68W TaxID=2654255 RepID=UPI00126419C2|nr:hypothetical protein [Janthinobacterium sp. FT68W]KAB8054764.1 hypothetical protein GCN78_03595 [Janthinobacterium sp. FT68W]
MTDTIKTVLCLKKIPQILRMDIPAQICNVSNPWGVLSSQYTKPSYQPSSMVDTMTKWVVRCAPGTDELTDWLVPDKIEAQINIPNAVAGQNVVHGTSVFAAGVAALCLQRNWLAQEGLPREQLDLLTTSDMELNGVTITFILAFTEPEYAVALIQAMTATGKALYGNRCLTFSTGNDTVVLPGRDFSVTAYIKSDFSHCEWVNGAPRKSIGEASPYLVRIEAKLGLPFLRKYLLCSLHRWQGAYARGLYEKIFNATVRKTLHLTGVCLRHKVPREEVFKLLTPTEEAVLRGYLATPALDPRKSQTVVGSANPEKRFYELRKPILAHARIDIDIPWKNHVKLRCFELEDILVYPGDFHPSDDHAAWSFCESNWINLRERLDDAYEAALAAALCRNVAA